MSMTSSFITKGVCRVSDRVPTKYMFVAFRKSNTALIGNNSQDSGSASN
jgi:hypothetical protein